MSKRSINKLAKVRGLLERQEKLKLAAANQKILQGQQALAQLQYQSATAQVDGKTSLAIVELAERAALSTAFALEQFKEDKERQQLVYDKRVFERKQSEKLLERIDEREKKEKRRKEQAALDDWTAANWGRR